MATVHRGSSVAGIVIDHPECARVFCDHRIDFCRRRDRSVEAACAERGLDVEVLLALLEKSIARRSGVAVPDPRAMSTAELISYIVSRHHAYLHAAFPFLDVLVGDVAREHGERNPKLLAVQRTFQELAKILQPHLYEEEGVLFPALRAELRDPRLIAAELASMEHEHDNVAVQLVCMRTLADDFTAPEWAGSSYRTLMRELAALEMNTLRHIHLETHVLMARFAA
jgi:regulator of cell morphogenesis and NO signaling